MLGKIWPDCLKKYPPNSTHTENKTLSFHCFLIAPFFIPVLDINLT